MKTNRVDTVLSTADFDAAKEHVAALTALVPFAVAVPDQERVGLLKLGDKSLGFVDKALEAVREKGDTSGKAKRPPGEL